MADEDCPGRLTDVAAEKPGDGDNRCGRKRGFEPTQNAAIGGKHDDETREVNGQRHDPEQWDGSDLGGRVGRDAREPRRRNGRQEGPVQPAAPSHRRIGSHCLFMGRSWCVPRQSPARRKRERGDEQEQAGEDLCLSRQARHVLDRERIGHERQDAARVAGRVQPVCDVAGVGAATTIVPALLREPVAEERRQRRQREECGADRASQNQRHGDGPRDTVADRQHVWPAGDHDGGQGGDGEQACDDGELDSWSRDPADAVGEEVARHQGDLEERQARHPH